MQTQLSLKKAAATTSTSSTRVYDQHCRHAQEAEKKMLSILAPRAAPIHNGLIR